MVSSSTKAIFGQWSFCLEQLQPLRYAMMQLDTLSFSSFCSASEKGQQWHVALVLSKQVAEEALARDTVLRSSALSLQSLGRIAVTLCVQEEPECLDLICFNAVISACEKKGQWQWALHLLQQIRGNPKLRASVVSFNAAISACEKGGAWECSLELLKEITVETLLPDITSFNGAISAAASGRRAEMVPDLVTFGAAVAASEAANLEFFGTLRLLSSTWPMAILLLDQMASSAVEATLISFNAAMSACAQCFNWCAALQLFANITAPGLGLRADVFSLNAAVMACARGPKSKALKSRVPGTCSSFSESGESDDAERAGCEGDLTPSSRRCETATPTSPPVAAMKEPSSSMRQALVEALEGRMPSAEVQKMMRDPQGSRLLVQHLSVKPKEALLGAVLQKFVRLACHEHASAVLLELMEGADEQLGNTFSKVCRDAVLKLARDKFGCRVLQRVLEVAPRNVQKDLAFELEGEVFSCSRHMHANFVLQKCVQLLPANGVDFIIKGMEAHSVEAAQHQYSCRVLQRLIEHCRHQKLRKLLENLLNEVPRLVKDTYGHNVIRAVLSYGEPDDQRRIIQYVRGHILQSARNRQSSLVLEKCLDIATGELEEERRALLAELLWGPGPPLLEIMLDRFGNYIAQRVIALSSRQEEERLQELLEKVRHKLRQSTNGKRILQAARRKFEV
eukprot:s857_g1.t3